MTEHEFGHQYWYGMVATNEFENAWLDEGINSYTEVKVIGQPVRREHQPVELDGRADGRLRAAAAALSRQCPTPIRCRVPATRHEHGRSYGSVTYGKTATMLLTLEAVVGEKTLRNAIHTYFMKYRFPIRRRRTSCARSTKLPDRTSAGTGSRRCTEPRCWITKCCVRSRLPSTG